VLYWQDTFPAKGTFLSGTVSSKLCHPKDLVRGNPKRLRYGTCVCPFKPQRE